MNIFFKKTGKAKTNRVGPACVISPDGEKLSIYFLIKLGCHCRFPLPATRTLEAIMFESNLMDMSINRYNFFLRK